MARCSICRRRFRRHKELRGAIAFISILRVDELRFVGHAVRCPLTATGTELIIEAEGSHERYWIYQQGR